MCMQHSPSTMNRAWATLGVVSVGAVGAIYFVHNVQNSNREVRNVDYNSDSTNQQAHNEYCKPTNQHYA